jgi:hypothetical protein
MHQQLVQPPSMSIRSKVMASPPALRHAASLICAAIAWVPVSTSSLPDHAREQAVPLNIKGQP